MRCQRRFDLAGSRLPVLTRRALHSFGGVVAGGWGVPALLAAEHVASRCDRERRQEDLGHAEPPCDERTLEPAPPPG